jgi:hypothetical protein
VDDAEHRRAAVRGDARRVAGERLVRLAELVRRADDERGLAGAVDVRRRAARDGRGEVSGDVDRPGGDVVGVAGVVDGGAIGVLAAERREDADLVRALLVEGGEDALGGDVAAVEARLPVLVDEVPAEGEDVRAVLAGGPRREEHLLDEVAAAVVAEERRVVAVVREDAHAPVVRLLADAEEADLREELGVRPAQLEVAPRVARVVARVVVGAHVVGRVAEDVVLEHVELHDDLEPVAVLELRRDAHPLGEEAVLPQRVGDGAGVLVDRRRRHVHRERALELGAELELAVDLDRELVVLRLARRDAAVVEHQAVEVFGDGRGLSLGCVLRAGAPAEREDA